jgi:beta-1,4-mannosyl-glycoprotein beta-1,4-N-acetylglucosaminyltransferase
MKIVDCFIFYNELDILELRFSELYDYVDHFVLVESTKTFTLKNKELFFEKNKSRYSKYLDKVIHIVVDDLSDNVAWSNEIKQRNYIDSGIAKLDLSDDDIVLISDVDEIPDIETINENKSIISTQICTLIQDLYYYNPTCKLQGIWGLAKVLPYKIYKTVKNPQSLRTGGYNTKHLEKGGWHFSYFGDVSFIKNKLMNFSHQEYNNEKYLNDSHIKNVIDNSLDLFGNSTFIKIKIEENNYLPKNINKILNTEKKFTFGYINHDESIHKKYLGPCLKTLNGEFDVIYTDNKNFPAQNYNELKDRCQTEYLILTHQDVSFPSNLLDCITETISKLDDWGVLGMVGVDKNGIYRWSTKESLFEVDTLDCCFMVIKKDSPGRFDEKTFDDYHLYVEDFCAQMNRFFNKKNYTLLINSSESLDVRHKDTSEINQMFHHGATVSKIGYGWGKYTEYRNKLSSKWGKIKTT